MSYVWGKVLINVSSAEEELPKITEVKIMQISPKNPKVNEDVSFIVRAFFDRALPKDLQLEAVVKVLKGNDALLRPCEDGAEVTRETVNAFAGSKFAQREFVLRFGEPGMYKVCFGFKPVRYYSGPGR